MGIVDYETLKTIAAYIIQKYPDSCFTENMTKYGMHYLLEDAECIDELIEEILKHYAYDVLGLCGCGIPERAWRVIRIVLNIQDCYRECSCGWDMVKRWYETDLLLDVDNDIHDGILYFILYILNNAGLLEHGSAVGGSWLTESGKKYLTVLNIWHTRGIEKEKKHG